MATREIIDIKKLVTVTTNYMVTRDVKILPNDDCKKSEGCWGKIMIDLT